MTFYYSHDGSRRQFLGGAAAFASASVLGFPEVVRSQTTVPLHSAADFIDSVGVCTHFGHKATPYMDKYEQLAVELTSLGLYHVRDEALVNSADSLKGIQYQRIRELVGLGFRFSMICYDPTNPYVFTPPSLAIDIFDGCNGGVVMFEGGNEPDLIRDPLRNPLLSAEHQRSLYQVVRSNPKLQSVRVAGPSYIQGNVAIAQNLSSACDFSNIHPYAGMEHPETTGPGQLQKFITASQRVFGSRPVMATEIGYHTALQTQGGHLPVSEAIKARYIPRTLLWPFFNGVKRTYLYELASSFNRGVADPESSFGLLDYNLSRTPAFKAVRNLLTLCKAGGTKASAATSVSFSTQDPERHHLLMSKGNGSLLVPVWLGVAGWKSQQKTALTPVERETLLTVQGNPQSVSAYRFGDDGTTSKTMLHCENNVYKLTVSDQLTVLELA